MCRPLDKRILSFVNEFRGILYNMKSANAYKYISNVREEGLEFYLTLQYVAYFYINIMKGRVRRDAPNTLIKYSRDWEYPWVLMKSKINPTSRVLDCGSGYSPIPFIWSMYGAESHAIDRDVMITSRGRYALHCCKTLMLDVLRLPLDAVRKMKEKQLFHLDDKGEDSLCESQGDLNMKSKFGCDVKILANALRFLRSFVFRNKLRIGRIWKSDFWGPIPPRILSKYGVHYKSGVLTKLPYVNECFDVVSCVSVLEHMSDKDRILGIREMSRVLKKGGRLIITYDKSEEDLTNSFIQESGLTSVDMIYFTKPDNLYEIQLNHDATDVIGICLVK